jgi:hypothetical protein
MIKECKKHGLTEFTHVKNGKNTIRWRCKKCAIESVQKRRIRIKEKAVAYKGGKCENPKCGYNKYIGALEFHHIDGDKEFGIGAKGYTRSWESVKKELDKCIMLCSNCHKETEADLLDISQLNNNFHINIHKKINYCIDCKIKINNNVIRCENCHTLSKRKVVRPSKEYLQQEIKEFGYRATSRKYNVSDNTIRKWVKYYNKHNNIINAIMQN